MSIIFLDLLDLPDKSDSIIERILMDERKNVGTALSLIFQEAKVTKIYEVKKSNLVIDFPVSFLSVFIIIAGMPEKQVTIVKGSKNSFERKLYKLNVMFFRLRT